MELENLIIRYLMGESSEQEALQMQIWMKASKENRLLFAQHKKIWLGSDVLTTRDTEKLTQDRKTLDFKIHNSELQHSLDKAKKTIRKLAYAASIALLLGISSFMYFMQQKTPAQPEQLLFGSGEIEVPYGSKSLVMLPDGSKVWVNAGSKITYPADFGSTSRNVYLSGEAYFDVTKIEDKPFFVNTDIIQIKVYGTAFNVKAYKDEDQVETMLDHGVITIIRIDAPDQEISVKPQQIITIPRESQSHQISSSQSLDSTEFAIPVKNMEIKNVISAEVITSWKDNRLVFEQEPLWSLAKQLERRYNVQINFSNERIKSLHYTAAIKEMPIDQVMEAISLSSSISFQIKGTTITLFEKK